jgi:hypothetical protein
MARLPGVFLRHPLARLLSIAVQRGSPIPSTSRGRYTIRMVAPGDNGTKQPTDG